MKNYFVIFLMSCFVVVSSCKKENTIPIPFEPDPVIIPDTITVPVSNPMLLNNLQLGQFNNYVRLNCYGGNAAADYYSEYTLDTLTLTVTNDSVMGLYSMQTVIRETLSFGSNGTSLVQYNDSIVYKHGLSIIPNYNNSGTDYLYISQLLDAGNVFHPSLFLETPWSGMLVPIPNQTDCFSTIENWYIEVIGCEFGHAIDTEIHTILYPHLNIQFVPTLPTDSPEIGTLWNEEAGVVRHFWYNWMGGVGAAWELIP